MGYLDGIRALSACYVMVHHTYMMAFPILLGVTAGGTTAILARPLLYGQLGVTVFIVLAGVSLGLGVARREGALPGGFRGYFARRARRLLPAYWAALLLTIVLVTWFISTPTGTHWDQSLPTSHRGWLADALLLQDVTPHAPNISYTFWSIAVEWHIYLLLPLMLAVRRLTGRWTLAIGTGLATGFMGMLAATIDHRIARLWPAYYVLFAAGVGLSVLLRQYPDLARRVPWRTLFILFALATAGACALLDHAWDAGSVPWLNLVAGCAALTLIGALHTGGFSALKRLLSSHVLGVVAGFSYSIYLIHAQLLEMAWRYALQPLGISREMQLLLGIVVVAPLIMVVAWLFARYFEKPFVSSSGAGTRTPEAVAGTPGQLS